MPFQILGALLLLSNLICGNDNGLTPRELTATALNSSAIRVSWKEPSRSGELNGRYELILYSGMQEEEFTLQATEDTLTGLEPSTTYDVEVSAFWGNGTAVDEYASTTVTTLPRASTPLVSESTRELEAEGELSYTMESPVVLDDLHNESSLEKTPHSSTDGPSEVEMEGKVTEEKEEEGEISGGGNEELPSDSHNSDLVAEDGAPTSSADGPAEVVEEGKVTEEKEEEGDKIGGDLGPSDGIVPTLIELSKTDETGDKTNKTLSPGSLDQPNSSEVSVISVVSFSLLCLSLVVAL